MKYKKIIVFSALLICFFAIGIKKVSATGIATPVIFEFSPQTEVNGEKLSVKGSVVRGAETLIYIDGAYVETLLVDFKDLDEQEFSYVYQENLSVGKHWLMVIAKDRTSLVLSPPTEEMWFEVKGGEVILDSVPAPTLFTPVVNNRTTVFQPFIVGLSKNNTRIRIYIDGKVDNEFAVENHLSGTANFAYKPSFSLSRGEHTVSAIAINNSKESAPSLMSFKVSAPAIASGVSEENVFVKAAEVTSQVLDQEDNTEEVDLGGGLVDENKNNSTRTSARIIVGALVVIGMIIWFLWRKGWLGGTKNDIQGDVLGTHILHSD